MLNKYRNLIEKTKSDLCHRQLQHYPKDYIDFSSNDYLGLSKNKSVINAGIDASIKYGSGATGSRLLSGNSELFENFEKQIAIDKHTESALLFNSGFQANSGVLECLCDKKTVVIFDMLNHASMYHGVFASGATLKRFQHLNYEHLEEIIQDVKKTTNDIIIVSDTVFGMDGDIADIQTLINLSEKYDTLLYFDEAHATGLYGKNGYGLTVDFDFNKDKTIIIGTLSKAIGASGAYIASSATIKDFLIQRCRSFIYSTALSPFCIGAAYKSWQMLPNLEQSRKKILNLADKLRTALCIATGRTNIIPVSFKSVSNMIDKKTELYDNGIVVSGIRPPTSPSPRLRIAINAMHSDNEVEQLIAILKK